MTGVREENDEALDGRTEAGMVFTTGSGADFTIWCLADFDTHAHALERKFQPGSHAGT